MNSGLEPSQQESLQQPEELIEPALKQNGLIRKVLTPAVKFWLRSQVEHVENLQVTIDAGDRQILSGCIPQVVLAAEQAVYQGLRLSQIRINGQNIRVNLRQVVRGQPLRILEPIPIDGTVLLDESDLNASLQAPLLKAGVTEFLLTLLRAGAADVAPEADLNLQNLQIRLEAAQVVIAASLISISGTETPIAIRTGFEMAAPNQLQLVNPQWLPHINAKRGLAIDDLNGYTFNLGSETEIKELNIGAEQITCRGKLTVRP